MKLLSVAILSAAAAIWGSGAFAQASGSKAPNPSTTMGNDSSRSDTGATVTRDSASTSSSTSGNTDRAGHMTGKLATISEGEFLGLLHHANQKEIELGELARTNASSPEVKDYANRIVKDHKAADGQVAQFAKENNVQMKRPVDFEHSEQMEAKAGDHLSKLRGLKGSDFDREFVRMMVKDHDKVINAAITGRDRFNDSKLTSLIDQLLPTLREHLQAAQRLERSSISSAREKSM